ILQEEVLVSSKKPTSHQPFPKFQAKDLEVWLDLLPSPGFPKHFFAYLPQIWEYRYAAEQSHEFYFLHLDLLRKNGWQLRYLDSPGLPGKQTRGISLRRNPLAIVF